jgi:hypothetical protein
MPQPILPGHGRIYALRGLEPLASGAKRYVFAHPQDPGLIIKVFRPDQLARWWPTPVPWRRRRRRYQHLATFLHELREQIAARAADALPSRHLQNIVGLADTDMGPGLVYEIVTDADGAPAPTLGHVVFSGAYGEPHAAALAAFETWLLASPIVLSELHLGNIVMAAGETGAPLLVLIDGIGDKAIIPLKSHLGWLNRFYKKRYLRKVHRDIDRALTGFVVTAGAEPALRTPGPYTGPRPVSPED